MTEIDVENLAEDYWNALSRMEKIISQSSDDIVRKAFVAGFHAGFKDALSEEADWPA